MNEAHFQTAIHDHLAIGLADAFRDVQQNAGMKPLGFFHQTQRERGGAAERRKPHRHLAGKHRARFQRLRLRLLHLSQNDLRMPVDDLAGIGHDHALLASCQQFLAEMLLDTRQLLAKRRLGNMQHIGRPGYATHVDNRDKRFQAPDIHLLLIIPLLLAGIRCSICRQSPSSISPPAPTAPMAKASNQAALREPRWTPVP
ncbi:hypothetical protein D3C72_945200 [compost metagenome]